MAHERRGQRGSKVKYADNIEQLKDFYAQYSEASENSEAKKRALEEMASLVKPLEAMSEKDRERKLMNVTIDSNEKLNGVDAAELYEKVQGVLKEAHEAQLFDKITKTARIKKDTQGLSMDRARVDARKKEVNLKDEEKSQSQFQKAKPKQENRNSEIEIGEQRRNDGMPVDPLGGDNEQSIYEALDKSLQDDRDKSSKDEIDQENPYGVIPNGIDSDEGVTEKDAKKKELLNRPAKRGEYDQIPNDDYDQIPSDVTAKDINKKKNQNYAEIPSFDTPDLIGHLQVEYKAFVEINLDQLRQSKEERNLRSLQKGLANIVEKTNEITKKLEGYKISREQAKEFFENVFGGEEELKKYNEEIEALKEFAAELRNSQEKNPQSTNLDLPGFKDHVQDLKDRNKVLPAAGQGEYDRANQYGFAAPEPSKQAPKRDDYRKNDKFSKYPNGDDLRKGEITKAKQTLSELKGVIDEKEEKLTFFDRTLGVLNKFFGNVFPTKVKEIEGLREVANTQMAEFNSLVENAEKKPKPETELGKHTQNELDRREKAQSQGKGSGPSMGG